MARRRRRDDDYSAEIEALLEADVKDEPDKEEERAKASERDLKSEVAYVEDQWVTDQQDDEEEESRLNKRARCLTPSTSGLHAFKAIQFPHTMDLLEQQPKPKLLPLCTVDTTITVRGQKMTVRKVALAQVTKVEALLQEFHAKHPTKQGVLVCDVPRKGEQVRDRYEILPSDEVKQLATVFCKEDLEKERYWPYNGGGDDEHAVGTLVFDTARPVYPPGRESPKERFCKDFEVFWKNLVDAVAERAHSMQQVGEKCSDSDQNGFEHFCEAGMINATFHDQVENLCVLYHQRREDACSGASVECCRCTVKRAPWLYMIGAVAYCVCAHCGQRVQEQAAPTDDAPINVAPMDDDDDDTPAIEKRRKMNIARNKGLLESLEIQRASIMKAAEEKRGRRKHDSIPFLNKIGELRAFKLFGDASPSKPLPENQRPVLMREARKFGNQVSDPVTRPTLQETDEKSADDATKEPAEPFGVYFGDPNQRIQHVHNLLRKTLEHVPSELRDEINAELNNEERFAKFVPLTEFMNNIAHVADPVENSGVDSLMLDVSETAAKTAGAAGAPWEDSNGETVQGVRAYQNQSRKLQPRFTKILRLYNATAKSMDSDMERWSRLVEYNHQLQSALVTLRAEQMTENMNALRDNTEMSETKKRNEQERMRRSSCARALLTLSLYALNPDLNDNTRWQLLVERLAQLGNIMLTMYTKTFATTMKGRTLTADAQVAVAKAVVKQTVATLLKPHTVLFRMESKEWRACGVSSNTKGAFHIVDLIERLSRQMPVLHAVPVAIGSEPRVANQMLPSACQTEKTRFCSDILQICLSAKLGLEIEHDSKVPLVVYQLYSSVLFPQRAFVLRGIQDAEQSHRALVESVPNGTTKALLPGTLVLWKRPAYVGKGKEPKGQDEQPTASGNVLCQVVSSEPAPPNVGSNFVYRLKVCDFASGIHPSNAALLKPVPPAQFTVEECDDQRHWRQLNCERIRDEMRTMYYHLRAQIEYTQHAAGAPLAQLPDELKLHEVAPEKAASAGASVNIVDTEIPLAELRDDTQQGGVDDDDGVDFEWPKQLITYIRAANKVCDIPDIEDEASIQSWADMLQNTTVSTKTQESFTKEIEPLLALVKKKFIPLAFRQLYLYTLSERQSAFLEGRSKNQRSAGEKAGESTGEKAGEITGEKAGED
jgi:hypothetical protein